MAFNIQVVDLDYVTVCSLIPLKLKGIVNSMRGGNKWVLIHDELFDGSYDMYTPNEYLIKEEKK